MIYELDGHSPQFPKNKQAWVADSADVIGKVILGADASVWFNAVLRGDNELIDVGAGSNVQDGCVLHTDLSFPLSIGANCTVGHNALLHGCTLSDHVLIGMGACVLNGAQIGEFSIIGAGALVLENTIIPPYSLVVGSPGKIIRTLDKTVEEKLRGSAKIYQDKWKRYKFGLKKEPANKS